jgi:hypothetical protein
MGLFAFNLARKRMAEEAAKAASSQQPPADKKPADKPVAKQAKPIKE